MSDPTCSTTSFRHVVLANLGLAAILLASGPAFAAVAPPLGAAQSFAVLGATPNVNNTGPTVVTGDLGVSPAAAVVGFPPGTVIGTIHAADATAASAQSANTTAYGVLAGEACNTSFGVPTDLAGMTLAPGVYCFASSAANTGLLQLDAMGNANAVWVFQIASTMITGSASSVTIINGGQACNVFWQVGSSATLGTTTTFVGNILALTDITLQTGASLSGRALAQTGTVTLASNAVSVCSLAGSLSPTTLTTQASPAVPLGGLIHDTATLSGGVAPTGTITFQLFGPNDASCTATPAFTSTVTVAGNGSYSSAAFTPSSLGIYRWIATYSGDAANAASATACNDANESVTISAGPAQIGLTPTLSAWAMVLLAVVVAFAGFVAMRMTAG
ncbi:MAG: ice-binding family protein [Rudaea sp.]